MDVVSASHSTRSSRACQWVFDPKLPAALLSEQNVCRSTLGAEAEAAALDAAVAIDLVNRSTNLRHIDVSYAMNR
eukprot:9699397-Heterocapsa_arctica.AAC.1